MDTCKQTNARPLLQIPTGEATKEERELQRMFWAGYRPGSIKSKKSCSSMPTTEAK